MRKGQPHTRPPMAKQDKPKNRLGKETHRDRRQHRSNRGIQQGQMCKPTSHPNPCWRTHTPRPSPNWLREGTTLIPWWKFPQLHQRSGKHIHEGNRSIHQEKRKTSTDGGSQDLHLGKIGPKSGSGRSHSTRRIPGIHQSLFRRGFPEDATKMDIQPPHWTRQNIQTKSRESLPTLPQRTKGNRWLCRRKPQEWKNTTFHVPPSILFLLHWKEGQRNPTMPRLQIHQWTHHQRRIPPPPHFGPHWQGQRCQTVHKVWHPIRIQQHSN